MLLSYYDLVKLVDEGVINADPANINGSSIDLTLAKDILVEDVENGCIVDVVKKQTLRMIEKTIDDDGFLLYPRQCFLASSNELFNLPNDITAQFFLKSSIGRVFLNSMMAGHCDPSWTNSRLTLELQNCTEAHILLLRANMKIGQVVFSRVKSVPYEHSYAVKGRYNNTTQVTASKGV